MSRQPSPAANNGPDALDLRPGQSIELLKALHILTRDGKINQDSRRKLKQVNHLLQFIEPLVELSDANASIRIVDHGAGKSYLGFMIYDRFFADGVRHGEVHSIETRAELVASSQALAAKAGFSGMRFHALSVAESITSKWLPAEVDIVTALHACNTATDDAIRFALAKNAKHIVAVPCCQAEVAVVFREHKAESLSATPLAEIWRHPLHTREFGSQITNVLRCLQLEAHGYQVTVTELVGWEHSMKNELIIASKHNGGEKGKPARKSAERLDELLRSLGLESLRERFFVPA
ncbi:MAG: SAM-dependent methyltransferase [Burkholderiales bacterium]|nr:SAM-dependent methyltransferase [Burkholderiales bacterium]